MKAAVVPNPNDGTLTLSLNSGYDSGRSVVQQADGKLLVGGYSLEGGQYFYSLVRLNANGTLDTSFSGDGKLMLPGGKGNSVIQQSDGKLVMAGSSGDVIRLKADGSLDSSFDLDGKFDLPWLESGNHQTYSVIQQADGKLVLAGATLPFSAIALDWDFSLTRLNVDGSLDSSFDTDGRMAVPVGRSRDYGYSVIQQADGKLVVAGASPEFGNTPESTLWYMSLIRLDTNGSRDLGFGNVGSVLIGAGLGGGGANSVIQQADGKLVVAGYSYRSSDFDFMLIRLDANGSVDKSFGINGFLPKSVTSSMEQAYSVIQQSDGKLVVAGVSGGSYSLIRLNPNGSLDTGFGSAGKLLLPSTPYGDGLSVIQQADGKLVVAGSHSPKFGDADFFLARVNTNGTLDTNFGKLFTTPPGASVAYIERGTATVLEAAAKVYDENLASSGYGGANVTLARNGGANPQDVFIAKPGGTLGALIEGGALVVGGANIGTVTTNSGGILKLTFNNPTQGLFSAPLPESLVNSALQQIAYKNDSLWQNTSIQIDWTFSDGNIGDQGTGGALSATDNVTVNVTATNDLLVLNPSASPTLPTITEYSTNPAGISVAGLVVDGSIFDDDKPNPVEAIVIEAVDTRVGTWQFSLNGGATWLNIQADLINSTTNTLGLALGPTALIRLLPFGDLSQTASSSITFRAWDQSDGNPSGSYFVFNPGVGSVSAASDVATASVIAVNGASAPELPNGTGKVIVQTTIEDSARSVVVQPDGKIVMAGLAYVGSNWDFAVTRLNANGSLDSSFGSGGKTTFDIGTGDDYGQTILARPDGKFVVAGYAINGVTDYFAVAQLNADGSLDTSFGYKGTAVVSLGKADRTLHQYLYSGQIAALQPDGKMVWGGSYNLKGAEYGYDFAAARLNADGSVDN
ncbi:MAG: hypothetical protein Q8K39_08270, partial [Undibacterium sp.]|nr:hypothetical protein [Undibacterium sp.]